MVLTRFLHLQIWNASNTAVQYDNKEDTNWGITSGSVELEKILMSGELNFGEINASKLEIQVFGLNVNLANRKIKLTAKESIIEADYLEDSDSNIIVTDLGDKIELIPEVDEYELFSGYVNSSEKDTFATDRTIEGYDWFYYHRDDDIASFWNDFWETHAEDTVTVKMLRDALLTHMGLTYTQKTLLNDNLEITNSFVVTHTEGSSVISETVEATALKFGDIFSMLCKLQNTCPVISNDFTNIEFVTLSTTVDYNITDNLERGECKYEDYVTNKVTGIGIYDSSDSLAQLVGTDTNVYKISGNIFLLNKTAQELTTIGTAILNDIKDIQYTPSSLKLIVSDITYKLGELVHTSKGNTYILSNNMSGSLVVDQILECKAEGALLSDKVENYNDTLIQGMKMSKIDKDIDHISLEVGEAIGTANEAKGEVNVLKNEVVLKVTSAGRIAKVALDGDPSTGTSVTILADDINLDGANIALNGTRGITITSPNFSVTSDGTITAQAGTIGGWTIGTSSIYSNDVTLSPKGLTFNMSQLPTYFTTEMTINRSGLLQTVSGICSGNLVDLSLYVGNLMPPIQIGSVMINPMLKLTTYYGGNYTESITYGGNDIANTVNWGSTGQSGLQGAIGKLLTSRYDSNTTQLSGYAFGYVTSSSDDLIILFPISIKPNVTSVTITDVTIALRKAGGGYILDNGTVLNSGNGYTLTGDVKHGQNLLYIKATRTGSSASNFGTNNNVCVGTVTVNLTIT